MFDRDVPVIALTHGDLEVMVARDFGPRILSFRRAPDENTLLIDDATLRSSDTGGWLPRGGHRLWIAPEDLRTTYAPDNEAPDIEWSEGVLVVSQRPDSAGIAKTMSLSFKADGELAVSHRIVNTRDEAVTAAPWALTMLAGPGTAVLPLPERGTFPEKLLPSGGLVLWPYTDLRDPRWRFSDRYVFLSQRADAPLPQKAGLAGVPPWCAYVRASSVFMKRALPAPGPRPDFGSVLETFTNSSMLELETLGPLQSLTHGDFVLHEERWTVIPSGGVNVHDDRTLATLEAWGMKLT